MGNRWPEASSFFVVNSSQLRTFQVSIRRLELSFREKSCFARLKPKKACMFFQPISRQNKEMSAYRFRRKSQNIRNINNKIRKRGKKKASREISHHLSGCKKALQQVRRNK